MTAALHTPFPHTWAAEILNAPPLIAPARHITLPRPVPGEEEAIARGALQLLIRPTPGQPALLATCALGFANPQLPTGVWSCPSPDEFCAVAGGYAYLVRVATPTQAIHLPLRPVTAVLPVLATPGTSDMPATPALLVFAGFHHLVAWSAKGLLWQTARLSWEGLTLTGLGPDGRLHGTGWDLQTDRDLPFSVDLRNGTHTGSPFPPKTP